MMGGCKKYLDPVTEVDSDEDTRFQRHLAQCPHCREQLETDRELRRLFQRIARPGPSLNFNLELRKRLRAERDLQHQIRWRFQIMRGYWIAACIASVVVIMSIRWPGELPPMSTVYFAGAALGMVLLVLLAMLGNLRIGPVNLILKSMDVFRQ